MCSFPTGNRGPAIAYLNHKNALSNSEKFEISEITKEVISNFNEISRYDVFWFSVRFDPNLYLFLKKNFPNKLFWMGPNVLFEKAEIGPSDEWEKWFIQNVTCDIYSNKADFYLERVRDFFSGSKKYLTHRNCIDLNEFKDVSFINEDRPVDVLIYHKKRRIDNQISDLYPRLLKRLDDSKINYDVINYGSYTREEYFKKLFSSKVCLWLSIEDYCSNAQLESMYLNVPVIGTQFNNTDVHNEKLNVPAATMIKEEWIKWNNDMPEMFFERVEKFLKEEYDPTNMQCRNHVLERYSYETYVKNLEKVLE